MFGGGLDLLPKKSAQKRLVALEISGTVGGLIQGPPLILRFLAIVPLDVQHLDGRVEGVVVAALICLCDYESHNTGRGLQYP